MENSRQLRVAIIGAGASGLVVAHELEKIACDDFVIFEKANRLGGTWRDNTYPGLRCDVPSHAYRFSFAPNPNWPDTCSTGAEIQAYLEDCAEKFGWKQKIKFREEVVEAKYEEAGWRLTTTNGDQGRFDVVITATGVLHHPVYPDIPGRDQFSGTQFHSARWDHSFDYRGKKVGVIGTGSTAIQIVGGMVDEVDTLKLFQRTAQWVHPLRCKPITEEQRQHYRDNPEEMEALYAEINRQGDEEFSAAIVGENPQAHAGFVQRCTEYLETVRDPELREKLTPDYKVGCKRLVMSDDFYEAIQRENAELVTDPIRRFVKYGIETATQTDSESTQVHELDLIVMATGFNTHQLFRPMKVVSPSGVTIDQAWESRNQGHRTVAIPGFPNWYMIGGPTSPIGNFSWLRTAETQAHYICQIVSRMMNENIREIVPTKEAAKTFNNEVRDKLPTTIWASGCNSWYIDENGNVASWPWTFSKFAQDLSSPNWDEYKVSAESSTS